MEADEERRETQLRCLAEELRITRMEETCAVLSEAVEAAESASKRVAAQLHDAQSALEISQAGQAALRSEVTELTKQLRALTHDIEGSGSAICVAEESCSELERCLDKTQSLWRAEADSFRVQEARWSREREDARREAENLRCKEAKWTQERDDVRREVRLAEEGVGAVEQRVQSLQRTCLSLRQALLAESLRASQEQEETAQLRSRVQDLEGECSRLWEERREAESDKSRREQLAAEAAQRTLEEHQWQVAELEDNIAEAKLHSQIEREQWEIRVATSSRQAAQVAWADTAALHRAWALFVHALHAAARFGRSHHRSLALSLRADRRRLARAFERLFVLPWFRTRGVARGVARLEARRLTSVSRTALCGWALLMTRRTAVLDETHAQDRARRALLGGCWAGWEECVRVEAVARRALSRWLSRRLRKTRSALLHAWRCRARRRAAQRTLGGHARRVWDRQLKQRVFGWLLRRSKDGTFTTAASRVAGLLAERSRRNRLRRCMRWWSAWREHHARKRSRLHTAVLMRRHRQHGAVRALWRVWREGSARMQRVLCCEKLARAARLRRQTAHALDLWRAAAASTSCMARAVGMLQRIRTQASVLESWRRWRASRHGVANRLEQKAGMRRFKLRLGVFRAWTQLRARGRWQQRLERCSWKLAVKSCWQQWKDRVLWARRARRDEARLLERRARRGLQRALSAWADHVLPRRERERKIALCRRRTRRSRLMDCRHEWEAAVTAQKSLRRTAGMVVRTRLRGLMEACFDAWQCLVAHRLLSLRRRLAVERGAAAVAHACGGTLSVREVVGAWRAWVARIQHAATMRARPAHRTALAAVKSWRIAVRVVGLASALQERARRAQQHAMQRHVLRRWGVTAVRERRVRAVSGMAGLMLRRRQLAACLLAWRAAAANPPDALEHMRQRTHRRHARRWLEEWEAQARGAGALRRTGEAVARQHGESLLRQLVRAWGSMARGNGSRRRVRLAAMRTLAQWGAKLDYVRTPAQVTFHGGRRGEEELPVEEEGFGGFSLQYMQAARAGHQLLAEAQRRQAGSTMVSRKQASVGPVAGSVLHTYHNGAAMPVAAGSTVRSGVSGPRESAPDVNVRGQLTPFKNSPRMTKFRELLQDMNTAGV